MPPPPPPPGLSPDDRLRTEVVALLRGGNAHVTTAFALSGIPVGRIHDRPAGFAHSLWELVEHMRFTQADILAFCLDAGYEAPDWPAAYWPRSEASPADWNASLDGLLDDLDTLVGLTETGDLYHEFEHAPGYTLLRELLLAADHTAHHLGQIVDLRRALGLWPPS